MKIVIAGGSGHLGLSLAQYWSEEKGHEVVVLTRGAARRKSSSLSFAHWDGESLGEWVKEVDGSDILLNLSGRTVNCRYTPENLKEMMDSRVHSTRILGKAIESSAKPPKLWLQMSTATIYAHSFDQANDEKTGVIGGHEKGVPAYWKYSIDIAHNWENELMHANVPRTRKVALRTSMVMGPQQGSVFDVLSKMTRLGLGGSIGGGHQYVSWIHYADLVRALEFLIEKENISGAVNVCAPDPRPQKDFMKVMRNSWGVMLGLPAMKWMAEVGAFFLRTDTELLLKSRRVVPGRLLDEGFKFQYPTWEQACADLITRSKSRQT